SCVGRHALHTLTQLRRSCSVGTAIFAFALPLYILTMDSSAAPPKAKTPRANSIDASGVVNFDEPEETEPSEKRPNAKFHLNYVSAPWSKVLQDFAVRTQTELVADRVPTKRLSRFDTKVYTRDEALKVLNLELKKENFQLQFKGNYLVLNALHEF